MKVQASDGKSELLNIGKGVYSKRVSLTWCEHLIAKNSQKIGLSEAFLGIAQNVHLCGEASGSFEAAFLYVAAVRTSTNE
jgi:hypothetical protein